MTALEEGVPAGPAEAGERGGGPPATTPVRFAYVPALDGLRAVAVLSVLLYHGLVSWSAGGFLGVDVFFTLSGYLITTLLLVERDSTGTVNLRSFWARRARRLLPALFLVVGAVVLYAAFAADPIEVNRIRGDGFSALFYVSNWRFVLSGQSYFEQGVAASPLRHTWSLGIEEQWYLIWPLVIAVLFGVAKVRPRHAAWGVFTAAGGSALLMLVLFTPGQDPSRVFYGTDTRAQALLVGAGLAMVLHGRSLTHVSRRLLDAAGLVALVGLLALFRLAQDGATWVYRGGFLLTAVLTAVVITVVIQPRNSAVATVLGGPRGRHPDPGGDPDRDLPTGWWPLAVIGRISYGLYLWHWPVYVYLSPDRTGWDGSALLAARLLVTFILAGLSYTLVEMPIRRGGLGRIGQRVSPRRPWAVATGVTVVVVVVLAGAVVVGTAGGVDPESASGTQTASAAGDTRVMLVGDSVPLGLGANFSRQAAGPLTVANDAVAGCGLVRSRVQTANPRVPARTEACDRRDQFWQDSLRRFRPQVVVAMPGATEVFDQRLDDGTVLTVGTPAYAAYLRSELDHDLAVLTADGARLALVTTSCFDEPTDPPDGPPGERADVGRVRWLNEQWAAFAAAHPDTVRLVDLASYTCPGYQRTDSLEGVDLLYDGVHFSRPASAKVWAWLGPRLRQAAP